MLKFTRTAAIAGLLFVAACSPSSPQTTSLEGNWNLDADASRLNYVTIKAGDIAENNAFTHLSGSVSADGTAKLEIDLASVSTGVDTRDGRMRDILFNVAQNPIATVSAQLDPKAYEGLKIGDSMVQEVDVTVSLKGIDSSVASEIEVTRLGANRVIAASIQPVIIDAGTFELVEGVEQLRELAGLPSISTAVPVTFSLVFVR